ncbi:hypothetical protein ACF3NG_09845 [Aerococcaceae bacterium WGS1372]
MRLTVENKRRIIRMTTIMGLILTVIGSIYISQSDHFKPVVASQTY